MHGHRALSTVPTGQTAQAGPQAAPQAGQPYALHRQVCGPRKICGQQVSLGSTFARVGGQVFAKNIVAQGLGPWAQGLAQ